MTGTQTSPMLTMGYYLAVKVTKGLIQATVWTALGNLWSDSSQRAGTMCCTTPLNKTPGTRRSQRPEADWWLLGRGSGRMRVDR